LIRSSAWLSLGLLAVTWGCTEQPSEPMAATAKWNVVFVSIDTLRPDHLGSYGYDRPTSPTLDRLAARSARFTRAYSTASWTLPAHMSMMTSQYPHVHGVDAQERTLGPGGVTLAEIVDTAGYDTAAFVSWFYVSKRYGFDRGIDHFVELLPREHDLDRSVRAETVVSAAIDWLRQPRDAPFFLFVHLFDPHMNYDPPPPFDSMFDADYTGSIDGRHATLQPYIEGAHRSPARIDARGLQRVVALYDGEIRYVDEQLARLLNAIDEAGLNGNTLIAVTSDHGEEFDEHGSMEGHQWTLYDEVLRVPLILHHPQRAASTYDGLVETLDIAPTLLDWLGLPIPTHFQGRSLVAALEGAESDPSRIAFAEIRRFNFKWAAHDSRYKLIFTGGAPLNALGVPHRRGYELYDLLQDPTESDNLFDPADENARRLDAALRRFVESSGPHPGDAGDLAAPFSEEERQRLRSLGYAQ